MIDLQDISLQAGTFQLRNIALRVASGEYFVLLGPTGSGKSLMLQCLCGIRPASSGRVILDGRDITDVQPPKRNIGYVPQDALLFSHLSVWRNITFGLEVRGVRPREALRQVQPIVDALCLGPILERSTVGLSGGETQKVAVARALAVRPKLLLLDEPASALDGPSRRGLCRELLSVQRQFAIATIHVSHNLAEAASVADRAGVMVCGRLVQTGTISELWSRPATEAVARIMGIENILIGTAGPAAGGSLLKVGEASLAMDAAAFGAVRVAIRPEAVVVHPGDQHGQGAGRTFAARLVRMEDGGAYCRGEFDVPDLAAGLSSGVIVAHALPQSAALWRLGEEYALELPPSALHVLAEDR